jgi:hypothetical protein
VQHKHRRVDRAKIPRQPALDQLEPEFAKTLRLYDESIELQRQGDVRGSTTKYLEALELQATLGSVRNEITRQTVVQCPGEIWAHIFSFLDNPQDVLSCSEVCREWRVISRSNSIWQSLFRKTWPHLPTQGNVWTKTHNNKELMKQTTVYAEDDLSVSMVWWRIYQFRFRAERHFQVLIADIGPITSKHVMVGHSTQLKPLNRGAWGGDLRIASSNLYSSLPSRIARARGHYWSAASGFNQYYIGPEVGVNTWFGETAAQRPMTHTGSLDPFVVEQMLQWIIMFGGSVMHQAQGMSQHSSHMHSWVILIEQSID